MSTLVDTALKVIHKDGQIIIYMESGVEIRFPVDKNPRLAQGTNEQYREG